MTDPLSRAQAEALDRADPLAPLRAEFALPDGLIYLDGNSLGALPRHTPARVAAVVEREWGESLIGGWNAHGWVDLPARVGARIARLIGAHADEVVAADSTSVNLFKLVAAALPLRPDRRMILSDRGNFPTDLYVAGGAATLLGRDHVLRLVEPEEVEGAIDETVALVMLTEVDYRTGRRHDMASITARAHAAGALTLWDLAHSAGAVELDLAGAGVDLAVGCGYKYLNGGPGAPAFLMVAQTHQAALAPALTGWFGHAAPFEFDLSWRPAEGIGRMLVGTPPVVALAALDAGLDLFDRVEMAAVRAKSLALTGLFIALADARLAEHGLAVVTPREPARRGSQVSLRHTQAYPVVQALIAAGVIGDFRAPDIARFGMTPLYTRFVDVWDAVDRLATVMVEERWRDPAHAVRAAVT